MFSSNNSFLSTKLRSVFFTIFRLALEKRWLSYCRLSSLEVSNVYSWIEHTRRSLHWLTKKRRTNREQISYLASRCLSRIFLFNYHRNLFWVNGFLCLSNQIHKRFAGFRIAVSNLVTRDYCRSRHWDSTEAFHWFDNYYKRKRMYQKFWTFIWTKVKKKSFFRRIFFQAVTN